MLTKRFLYSPIPTIELLLSLGVIGFAFFLSLPPYETLVAQGLGTTALVLSFCLGSFCAGLITVYGVLRNKKILRKWGSLGVFLVLTYLSLLILFLSGATTGIWAITLSSALIAGICHITEKTGLP